MRSTYGFLLVIFLVSGLHLFLRHCTRRLLREGERRTATVTDIRPARGGRFTLTYMQTDESGKQLTDKVTAGKGSHDPELAKLQVGDTLTVVYKKGIIGVGLPLSTIEHSLNTPFHKTAAFRPIMLLIVLMGLNSLFDVLLYLHRPSQLP
jgi:hypothetical protein